MKIKVRNHPIDVYYLTGEHAEDARLAAAAGETKFTNPCFTTGSFGYDGWTWDDCSEFETDYQFSFGNFDWSKEKMADKKVEDVDVRTLAEDLHGRLSNALQVKVDAFCDSMKANTYDFLQELMDGKIKVDADLIELATLVDEAARVMVKTDSLTQKLEIN